MINKSVLLLLFCILAAGCSAKLMRMPGSKASLEYAPVNEKHLPGVVRYLNEGMKSVRDSRRKSAYRKMYDICGGRYKITGENSESDDGAVYPMGNMAYYASSKYQYIYFECVE